MERLLRLPTEDITRTIVETLGLLLESHFFSARFNAGSEVVTGIIGTGASNADSEQERW